MKETNADPVGDAFDAAAADQAAIESRQARRKARREAISTAMDPEASKGDRKRAEQAWAQAILDDLDAQANAKGIDDRTPRWARYVRRGLEAAARRTPALADEIGVLLAGVPDFDADTNVPGGPASTNRMGGASASSSRSSSGGLVGAAGVSGPVVGQIVVFGTEQRYIDEVIRRIRQTQRGNS